MLRRVTARGALETAARPRQFVGQAFRYAVATGRGDCDPTGDLRGKLPSPTKGHFSAFWRAEFLGERRKMILILRQGDARRALEIAQERVSQGMPL
jgi:hypothetical protein